MKQLIIILFSAFLFIIFNYYLSMYTLQHLSKPSDSIVQTIKHSDWHEVDMSNYKRGI